MFYRVYLIGTFLFLSACNTNPVNPIESGLITLQYSVEKTSHVNLYIENAYGTKVKTLVDKQQDSGNYTVQFSLVGLPEGVYYYVLSVGENQMYRKRIVVLSP
jgi:hypothetical protein